MRVGVKTSQWKFKRDDEVVDFTAQGAVVTAQGAVVVNDFLTLRNLAIAGGGVAMLPTYAVHAECASDQLSAVLSDWKSSDAILSAIYPSRRGATLKQQAFIDQVREVAESLS